jgi:hypothetical protein
MLKNNRTSLLVVSVVFICTACVENPPSFGPRGSSEIGYVENKRAEGRYSLSYEDIDSRLAVAGFARRAKELCPGGYSVSSHMSGTVFPHDTNLDPSRPDTRYEEWGEVACK